MPVKLAVVDDARFDLHEAPSEHPERPARLRAARAGLNAAVSASQRTDVPARRAETSELTRIHPEAHVNRLRAAWAAGSGYLDADTYFNAHTESAAYLAAGACIDMVHALQHGQVRRGLALVRPPGHHAEPTRSMGFCWFNNIAVAAHAALDAGMAKVAIVDWDVHHGNGTQVAFEADPRVLFVSLHQAPLYPGSGSPSEIGADAGRGYTANLALPAHSGPSAYALAFREVVLPLLEAFAPDLILVSAGFDGHERDPLASMDLDDRAYGWMTTALVDVAERQGHGRVGLVLEGGYDLMAVETSIAASCRALLGERFALPDADGPSQAQRAIARTREQLRPYWPLLGDD